MSKKVVIAFGRLNPITNGHEKLANKIKSVAKSNSAVAKLYLSHSTNPKKDPLEYQTKIKFAKKAFGNIVTASPAKTIFEALQELDGKFDEVIVVAGSDRVSEFDTMIKKYNGNLYNFKTLEAVSAGERDPDAEGVEGMSASKMRGFAAKNDFESFKKGVPSKLSETDAKKLFDEVRKGMKINENTESNLEKISEALEENLDDIFSAEMLPDLKEVLSLAGRRKRAMQIRRLKAKIQRSRMLALKRFAGAKKLRVRSRRLATKFLKRRLSGGKNYASMSAGQKQMIDKKIEKLRPAVTKIASRLLPRVRKTELERKRGMSQKKESFDLDDSFINLFEGPKLPQDKDVASREGTQPKKYYSGLDKSTKQSRDAHFKAHAKKSDSDSSSYKDAPGDKKAREKGMPESEHTKKFKQMYGEQLDKKQVGRLEQLVRLGLADKTMLVTIKRAIDKIGKGDTLTPPERLATQSLLNTLLDMVTSADSLFRLTKTQVQKEEFIFESESEEEDDQESDGLYMARVQLSNLIDDTEEILTMMESMEEEPEEWILSKITLAADYMSTARDYLEYYSDDEMEDDEEDEEDEEYEFPEYEVYECIADMSPEDFGDLKEEFMDLFEEMDGLKKKSEKSGIPYGILKQVYNRGMAAWKGGHRPGTTPQQWAYARVNSFITKGKGTWGGADSDLAAKVKGGKKETNETFSEFVEALEYGTDAARMAYARATPGQNIDVITAKYSANSALELMNDINLQRKFKLFSENKEFKEIDEAVEWHTDNKVSFSENVFRVGSESYYDLYKRVRELHAEGKIELSDDDRMLIEETDIGEIAEYEGQYVPLDCPMIDEGIAATIGAMVHGGEYKEALKTLKDVMTRKKSEDKVAHNTTYYAAQVAKSFKHVDARKLASMMEDYEEDIDLLKEEDEKDPPLNQPKRGGPKKFYVYVRDPSSGNIKKVSWGDTTGLSVKLDDPEARKSFAARHQCSTQKDRTSAAYWACNTPRYAKQLGLSGGGNFFW
jgi:hypothetical protein